MFGGSDLRDCFDALGHERFPTLALHVSIKATRPSNLGTEQLIQERLGSDVMSFVFGKSRKSGAIQGSTGKGARCRGADSMFEMVYERQRLMIPSRHNFTFSRKSEIMHVIETKPHWK